MNATEKRCTDTNVRALESSNEYAALQCVFIANGEPPYADPHVRWCGRSENKSRRKPTFVFLLPDLGRMPDQVGHDGRAGDDVEWLAGEVFCDAFDVGVNDGLFAGSALQILKV